MTLTKRQKSNLKLQSVIAKTTIHTKANEEDAYRLIRLKYIKWRFMEPYYNIKTIKVTVLNVFFTPGQPERTGCQELIICLTGYRVVVVL